MLPESYVDADMRCVQPFCLARERCGVAFDVFGQQPIRLALTLGAAAFLRDSLDDYIKSLAGTQSPGSELMPSEPKSVPSEGEKV